MSVEAPTFAFQVVDTGTFLVCLDLSGAVTSCRRSDLPEKPPGGGGGGGGGAEEPVFKEIARINQCSHVHPVPDTQVVLCGQGRNLLRGLDLERLMEGR